jgi:hypothetical protein
MAVKLVARMSLVDKFTGPMRNVERQIDRNQRALDKMRTKASRAGTSMDKLNTSSSKMSKTMGGVSTVFDRAFGKAGNLISALNPLNTGFLGIASAAGLAYGAVKIFHATVGEAMKMQQSQFVITAMFDDEKLSADYMKLMDEIAIKSPLLDSQTMYGNSKSFITASKDLGQLEKMWSLAERLVASDPQQGLEGAIYALRELFSGDSKSIVERFEMPRSIMKDIKNLPLAEQLAELDTYFNTIGLSTELIDKMGSSALGMWSQVKERFQLIMRDMGEPSLKVVSEFLAGIMDRLESEDMAKFAAWGGEVIANILTGMSNNAIKLYDWFVELANSEEFKSKSTLFGKVEFIIADIADKLQAWYDNGGRDKLESFGQNVVEVMLSVISSSMDQIAPIAAQIGASLWAGIETGLRNSASQSTLGKIILGGVKTSGPYQMFKKMPEIWKEKGAPLLESASKSLSKNLGASHSAGLERVPYDGYAANLHKGETVLNPADAREYREGSNGGINISGNTFYVREESDIEKIAMKLAQLIEGKGGPVPA